MTVHAIHCDTWLLALSMKDLCVEQLPRAQPNTELSPVGTLTYTVAR